MAKPDLGNKHKCQNCGTKFFDLNKSPVVCPKCGETQSSVGPAAAVSRAAAREPVAVEDDEPEVETGAEVLSLDDADQAEDGKVAPAVAEDDVDVEDDDTATDDDTFLEEDEDDGGDVADLIDGDIEDDEER